ncbi:MAG: LCP family protein [Candidatus Uhrbacteria bacterium]|nr:LCP family protein [Candidatus Uhrbacteria bacterium]
MQELEPVDFLEKDNPLEPERMARQRFSALTRLFASLVVIGAIGGVFVSAHIAKTNADSGEELPSFSLLSSFRRLVSADDKALAGEDTDRINVLLLGVGGAGHDGPELSDTIMFASYKPSTSQVGIISIPRDLTVNIPGYGYRKINSVNAYAEMEEPGSGPEAAKEIVGDIMGENINYVVKVDFGGFEDIIDSLGGVDIYVDTAFSDATYPVDDDLGSVKSVSFEQGWAHMDGETALIYSRSRHGTNGEGSDFARAARQQKLLMAVKEKTLSLNVLLNPAKLNRLLTTITNNVDTDLSIWEMMKLARYVPAIDMDNVTSHVLDSSNESPLYSTTVNGAYVLLPKKDDWSDLRDMADHIFSTSQVSTNVTTQQPAKPELVNAIVIEVQNGTPTIGLAARTAELLQSSGFTVAAIGNAAERSYNRTVIYDFTNGSKPNELTELQTYLDAEIVMSPSGYLASQTVLPDEIASLPTPASDDIDFLIVVGENSKEVVMR